MNRLLIFLILLIPIQMNCQFYNKENKDKEKPIISSKNNYLINDPYKNHLTGERDGFKNKYSVDEFVKHNKGYGIRYKKL